jgi:hypothetical protein
MIIITQGTTNTIILTLTERVTIANPVFLFECICDQTKQVYHVIASDLSQFSYRYNAFHITEKTSPDTTNGEISLPLAGDYHYAVYQQSSGTNLDPTLVLGLLETGKLTVVSNGSDTPERYEPAPGTNVVYGG